MTDAAYQVKLEESDGRRPTIVLMCDYRVRVFKNGQTIELPMNREEGEVLTAELDGVDAIRTWNEAGTRLALPTSNSGEYY